MHSLQKTGEGCGMLQFPGLVRLQASYAFSWLARGIFTEHLWMKARSTIGYMPLFTNNEYKCIAGGCSGVELIIG